MNSRTNDNTLFTFAYDIIRTSLIYSMDIDLKKTLEALLLSTAEPITLKAVVKIFARYHIELNQAFEDSKDEKDEEAELMEVPSPVTQAQIRDMLIELTDEAEVQDKAYRVVERPNGYQIVTAPQFAEFVRLLRGEPRPIKLSPAALETMSIIAYRQPVTRAEMEAIRGVSVDSALNKLIELELALVIGRAELPGRPIQYGTTEKFLEFTGIKELDELPASDVLTNHQIDDWMRRSDEDPEEISDEINLWIDKELK